MYCSVLQCVVVCCSVLQCVAVCRSVFKKCHREYHDSFYRVLRYSFLDLVHTRIEKPILQRIIVAVLIIVAVMNDYRLSAKKFDEKNYRGCDERL